jgi:Response regulator containing CheY-like receiver, AAA-type ATPase, and DNA-binding domains
MSKAKILVVDDEENIRFLLSEELADEGYDVKNRDGTRRSAFRSARKEPFDLVVLDIEMPGKNGLRWPVS